MIKRSIVSTTTRICCRSTRSSFQRRNSSSSSSSWNSRLRLLAKEGHFLESLHLYRTMLLSGHSPDRFTFPFAIKSCAALSFPLSGAQIHCHVIKTGCLFDPFVQTSLISMYSKCYLLHQAHNLFNEIPPSNKSLLVCYNALISGFTLNSRPLEALALFRRMRRSGIPFTVVTMLGLIPSCALPTLLGSGMSLHACNIKFGQCSQREKESQQQLLLHCQRHLQLHTYYTAIQHCNCSKYGEHSHWPPASQDPPIHGEPKENRLTRGRKTEGEWSQVTQPLAHLSDQHLISGRRLAEDIGACLPLVLLPSLPVPTNVPAMMHVQYSQPDQWLGSHILGTSRICLRSSTARWPWHFSMKQ